MTLFKMFYCIDYMTVMQNWAHSDVAKLWSGWNALRNGLFWPWGQSCPWRWPLHLLCARL